MNLIPTPNVVFMQSQLPLTPTNNAVAIGRTESGNRRVRQRIQTAEDEKDDFDMDIQQHIVLPIVDHIHQLHQHYHQQQPQQLIQPNNIIIPGAAAILANRRGRPRINH